MEKKKRGSFTGEIGFVLAAAGSAVGLGNLWRFPYLAAQYGGGIFILVYIILALTFGFTLMTTEIAIGRKTKLSPTRAYKEVDSKFGFIGPIAFIIPVIILPYYCVIGGWVTKYVTVFAAGQNIAAAEDSFFGNFIGREYAPLIFFIIFLGLTSLIVISGVEKGIEKVSSYLMPALIVLAVIICIYVITIPGSSAGIKYYLLPDFSKFSFKTVCAAMGQMFYSLSIAMGILVTFGSYMKKDVSIESSTTNVEIFDTAIAIMAGLMIIPAVFAFSGGDPDTLQAGPSLMFITIPKVFDSMGFGTFAGILFFLLVLFAAVTSSIALTESAVSTVEDELKWSRKKSTVIVGFIMIILGTLSCLGYGPLSFVKIIGMQFLDFFDFLTNSVMMPIAALMTSLFVSKVVGVDRMEEEIRHGESKFRRKKIFVVMIKYLCPIFAIIILVSSVANAFGWISM